MSENELVSYEIRRLKSILDQFPVGAVKIENVRFPGEVKPRLQSVNLLRSKLRYLDIIGNLTDSVDKTDNVEKKSVRTECIDTIGRIIAEDKAVDAGIVAEYLNDIVQGPGSDELKQKVLKQLGCMETLVFEFNELNSTLMELKSSRMNLEESLKDQLENTRVYVNEIKDSEYESDVSTHFERRVEKTNKMRRLINALLLGPGSGLQDKWLDVFYSVRDCVTIDDLFL